MNIILLIIGLGVLSWEIVNSSLSMLIKARIFNQKMVLVFQLLSSLKVYKKIFSKWIYFPPLTVFIFLLIILSNVYLFTKQLLECPFCTSFWIGLFASLLFFPVSIMSLAVAGCSMMSTALYNLIRIKAI
jgi:hypothetical protein